MPSRRYRIGGPYSFIKPAAFWKSGNVQGQAAPTLAQDWFDATVATNPQVSLAAVEGADTASFSISLRQRVTLAATEGADTASFSIGLRQRITLGATEAPDVASFSIGLRQRITLGATEASDTASFAVGLRQRLTLGATEGPDVASFAIDVVPAAAISVDLDATEGPDTAQFTVQVVAPQTDFPVTPGFLEPEEYLRLARRRARKIRVLTQRVRRKKEEGEPFSRDLDELERLVEVAKKRAEEVAQTTFALIAEIEARRAVEQARRRREDDEIAILASAFL